MTPLDKASFDNNPFEVSQTTHKKFYTRLHTIYKFTEIPVVITPYTFNFINIPTIQAPPVQPVPPVQPEQPLVDPSTQAGSSTPLQVLFPISRN